MMDGKEKDIFPDNVEDTNKPLETSNTSAANSEASPEKAKWYVIHTYSGYENQVKDKIQMIIENRQDQHIFDVRVPLEKYVEVKDNERVVKERKTLPGYVMVKMIITPQSWYLIRNTNGVTGFVGTGTQAVPLTAREVAQFGVRDEIQHREIDVNVGDSVDIVFGPFSGFAAKVEEVNREKETLKALITMFGRETSVELSFDDIEVG